jgi:hypothetical protein
LGIRDGAQASNDARSSELAAAEPPRGHERLRELTVTTLNRASARHGGREQAVPYLRIAGRWLEQYGLTRGCRVVVSGELGKLVLTVDAISAGGPPARG